MPESEFLHKGERGELRLWLPAPTVFVFQYKGYSDADFIPFVESVYAATLGTLSPPYRVFVDCEEQSGFAHGFRTGIMDWSKRVVPLSDTYCLLVRSRIVAMGMALARVAIGKPVQHAEVTTSREIFDAKLATAVERYRAPQS